MNAKALILFFLFFATVTTPVAAYNNDPFGFQHLSDSLEQRLTQTQGKEKYETMYCLHRIYSMTQESDQLFELINQAIALADSLDVLKYRMEARSMLMAYYNNLAQPDTFLIKVPPLAQLAEELGDWDTYFIIYDKIATWTRVAKGNEAAIEVTEHIYRKAKELNNPVGLGSALKLTGQTCIYQRRINNAKKHLIEAIDEFKKVDVIPLKFEAYIFYVLMPGKNKNRFDRLQMLKLFEEDLAKLDKKLMQRWILPEYSLRFYLNRMYCESYLENKQFNKAEEYYHRLLTEPSIKSPMNGELIYQLGINLYTRMKQFDKALALTDSLEKADINIHYHDKLIRRIDLYRAMDETENMYQAFKKLISYNDSIHNTKVNAQLDELRTIFEVDRLTLEKENQRTYTIAAIAGCILLLFIMVLIIGYNRKLQAKHLSLYRQIQEHSRSIQKAEQNTVPASNEEFKREAELFRKLNLLMKTEHLFTNPDLDRRKLSELLSTNEKYLADAIRYGSDDTVSAYIAKQRLQYALHLLNTQPDMPIEVVATESGHSSYSSFFRTFTKGYGMNPSEYRRLSLKKS